MSNPIRVLIVEDRQEDALLMIREIERAGFRPDWRRVDSLDAVIQELRPEVEIILADYVLPGFEAPQLLDLIRDSGLDIPVIVVTGAFGDEAVIDCLKRGAADYVLKDRLRRLGASVEQALEQRQTRALARRTAEALRESEARFRLLMNGVRDYALVTIDSAGLVASWNAGARRIYGFQPHQILGRPLVLLHPEAGEPRDHGECWVRRAGRDGRFEHEGIGRREDGSTFWADVVMTRIGEEPGLDQGFALVARDVTERRQTQMVLEDFADRIGSLNRRLFEVQEAERRHLALELHDQVGQSLAAIKLLMHKCRSRRVDPAQLEHCIDEGLGLVDETIHLVRNVAMELRPAILDQLGLVPALEWLLRTQASRAGFDARLQLLGRAIRMAPEVETACFRVVQEALNNVVRHAGASRVRLILRWTEDRFNMVLRDDGNGFDRVAALDRARRGRSLGLIGMEERIRLIGGAIAIRSSPGRGTGVAVMIRRPPLARANPEQPPGEAGEPDAAPGAACDPEG